jgi:hypothetical protein
MRLDQGFDGTDVIDPTRINRKESPQRKLKIPPDPFFKEGNTYTPVWLVIAIGAFIPPQAFLSSPFEKGGQGNFITRTIGTNFWHSL